jgi:hypothetical protein
LKDKVQTSYRRKKEGVYLDRSKKGNYNHKDSLRGKIKVYDRLGNHIDVLTFEVALHPFRGEAIANRNIKDELK